MSVFRNLMSSKVRSNAGCWTCRLRRKKCDEKRPVCDSCGALEISCYFGEDKPDWMDGAEKQKEMADRIKSQVKKQASQRRDRKYMELLENGTRNVQLGRGEGASASGNANSSRMGGSNGTSNFNSIPPHAQSSGHGSSLTPPSSNTSGASPPEAKMLFEHQDAQEDGGPDVDVHFIMMYLDYVFPYLFPYYRPHILTGGRGWVLDTLQSKKSVYYTAISLAAYFFGVIMAGGQVEHKECTDRMADKLQHQLQMGLRELQKEMRTINERQSNIYEQLVVMQGIIQMVTFEIATSNGDNWKIHLDAAIALFFKILPQPEQWTNTLHGLYTPRWPPPSMGVRKPWSTNQAAIRFFTANLFHMDVMSSIALERPPRLQHYQDGIIPGCFSKECREHAQTAGPLFMDDFVGLHNWIIQMIGDVAALDAWKKEAMAAGTLSMNDLMSRGQILADALQGSLASIEEKAAQSAPASNAHAMMAMIVQDPMPDMSNIIPSEVKDYHPAMAMHNKIWIHAILTYLYTTVFGWQPEQFDIKRNVDEMTSLLSGLPRGSCLRGMVFPFCIAGCLCPREDEEKYRNMVKRLGPLQVFGTIKEASEIQEKVWACRAALDETWDVAKCLRILGHRSLLI